MPDSLHLASLATTTSELFQKSSILFWNMLPAALLLAMLVLYVGGEISGGKIADLFRRLIIAIILLVAFPEISRTIQGLEVYLIDAFGGDATLSQVFSKVGERASEMKSESVLSWMKIGQIGLGFISTLSFLILALIRHFLDVLHLTLWNLMHVLAPIALIGCLFPSFTQVPRGIFMGMLELSLWKPVWIIMARLLLAAGFGEQPQDISHWFDTAVLNLTVAGLMASTPILVHSFLSGSLGAMGGTALQTLASGTGSMLASAPMKAIQSSAQTIRGGFSKGASATFQRARSSFRKQTPTQKK